MTSVWFADIFIDGSRCILFDDIQKNLNLHTEVSEEGRIKMFLIQDNWGTTPTTAREV